jgi:arylsulfatase
MCNNDSAHTTRRIPFTLQGALGALVCLFLSVDSVEGIEPTESQKRPNVLVILTDDQGYGDVSAHGNPLLKTPSLDRLHAASCRFTRMMVAPTCAPTRSQLMTGRHEFFNGITHTILERERLRLDAVTLPQVLQKAGYQTGIFGKWHLGDEAPYQPNQRGFDEVFIHGAGGIGQSYPGSCGDAPGNSYFDPWILHNGKFEKTSGYCTDVFFRQAREWIGKRSTDSKPWFAWIATNAPHSPYIARPEDRALYEGKGLSDKEANFFGMVHNIDTNIGETLDLLRSLSIDDETLVIFMNDNGGTEGGKTFNANMRGLKGTPWVGGTRATSFWSLPGNIQPGDCDVLAGGIDVAPTMLDFLGIQAPDDFAEQFQGRSLRRFLTDANKKVPSDWSDRTLVAHVGRWEKGVSPDRFQYRNASIRNDRYALVSITGTDKPAWQLFDLLNDPSQKTNIAAKNPEIVEKLGQEFDRWWSAARPNMVNEDVPLAPANPYKVLFEAQVGAVPAR